MTSQRELEIDACRHLLGYYGHPEGYRPGGFTTTLIMAFERADDRNTMKLKVGFPEFAVPVEILKNLGIDLLAEHMHDLIRHKEAAEGA